MTSVSRRRGLIHLAAGAGIIIISFSAVLVRLANVSPSTAAFFRTAYASPALFVVWLLSRSQDRRTRLTRWMALGSGALLALDLTLWHHAIAAIGVGLATILANIQVMLVALVAWLLHRERPSAAALVTIPVILGGIVLISGLGRPDAYGSHPVIGVLFGTAAGCTYACFLLLFRASNMVLAPAVGPLLDATLGATLATLLIGLVSDPHLSLMPTWPQHGWLITLALLPHVVGWLLIAAVLPRLPALETSVMLLGQPVLTVIWGLLLFKEDLSAVQWTGIGLVLSGVGWLTARGSVVPAIPTPAGSPGTAAGSARGQTSRRANNR